MLLLLLLLQLLLLPLLIAIVSWSSAAEAYQLSALARSMAISQAKRLIKLPQQLAICAHTRRVLIEDGVAAAVFGCRQFDYVDENAGRLLYFI